MQHWFLPQYDIFSVLVDQFSWIPEEQDKFTVIQKNGIFVVTAGRIVCFFFSIILNGIQRNDRNVSAMVDIYTDKEMIETWLPFTTKCHMYTIRTVPKSIQKIVETEGKSIALVHITNHFPDSVQAFKY